MDALREYTANVTGYHEQFSKYLKEQTLPKLNALESDTKKQAKKLKKKIQQLMASTHKAEEEYATAASQHEKVCYDMVSVPFQVSITILY